MKNRFPLFLSVCLALGAIFMMAAVHPPPPWQPSILDDSLVGDGTGESPLGTDVTSWEGILTQASTSAPTATVIDNELTGSITWTYTGVGIYTGTIAGTDFTSGETFVDFTIGNATGLVPHAYSITDSTVVLKTFDAAGSAVNLAGTAYLRVTILKE